MAHEAAGEQADAKDDDGDSERLQYETGQERDELQVNEACGAKSPEGQARAFVS